MRHCSSPGSRMHKLRQVRLSYPDAFVEFAVALSLALGLIAGFLAAQRLVRMPALRLLTGRTA